MSKRAKNEYLLEIKIHYQRASKEEKRQILDEFCKVCGYNRKYAIRILNKWPDTDSLKKRKGGKKMRFLSKSGNFNTNYQNGRMR